MSDRVRILVLEDDPDLREELCDILRDEGYEVEAASKGEDAVALAARASFDLVVADVRMQGMDGLEALERMRAHQPDVRSMVITGYTSEEQSIRAVRLGVGEYLKKPFSLQDFLEKVSVQVSRRHAAVSQQSGVQALRQVAAWALEALAAVLDERDGERPGQRTRAGQLAGALAEALGMESAAGADLRMAALVAAIRALDDADSLRGWEAHPALRQALDAVQERWDGGGVPEGLSGAAIPLEARVVAVAVEAALVHAELGPPGAERLREQHPGRFDPRVLDALAGLRPGEVERGGRQASSRIRGLLALGQTLEARGDAASARRAFAQVLRDAAGSREAIVAEQRMAALSVAAGQVDEASRSAMHALEAARRLGPVAAAGAGLESGLLLLPYAPDRARAVLEEALGVAMDMRLVATAACAHLALARMGGSQDGIDEALGVLLQPEHAAERARASSWLLPLVLERAGRARSPVTAKAAARMVRDGLRPLQVLLERGDLSTSGRSAAAAALAGVGDPGGREILTRLAQDPEPDVRRAATVALQERGREPESPLLRIYSLGALEVYRGEQRIDESQWHTQKVKFLFAYLAASTDRPVPEDLLIETFWPGDAEKGKRGLYSATSVLRRILEAGAPAGDAGRNRCVLRVGSSLQLDPALARWHDLEELERALAEARRFDGEGRQQEARDRYCRVSSLYRGPYLEGCYMDWALGRRDRLEQAVLDALLRLSQGLLETGRAREALEHAGRILELDPCHQEAYGLLMQAHVGAGRAEEAVRLFERCEKTLRRELDMEPSMKLVELYHRARLSL